MKLILAVIVLLIIPNVVGSSISIDNVHPGGNISFQVSAFKTSRKSSVNTIALCGDKLFVWKSRAAKGMNKFNFSFKNPHTDCILLSYGLGTGNYSMIRVKPKARITKIVVHENMIYLKTSSNLDNLLLINNFGRFKIKGNGTFEHSLQCGNYNLNEKLTYFGRVLDERTIHVKVKCFKFDAVMLFLCLSVFLNIILIIKR